MRRSVVLLALVAAIAMPARPAPARRPGRSPPPTRSSHASSNASAAPSVSAPSSSVRKHGKVYGGGGFEAVVTNENRRPNKVREEFTFGGLTGVTAFDGKTGWKIEPWAGKRDAEPLGEDETKGIIEDAEFDDPLLQLQGTRKHRRAHRHRPDRGHGRLQAPGDAREQRRRAHLLSRRRVVRADQVRGEAHRPRRGAVVRSGAGRL